MPVRILVTGFGAFPGAAANPSQAVLRLLARDFARAFARAGLELRTACLPVLHEGAQARVAALTAQHRPDAILHQGLAARRASLSLEARACNRMSLLHADSSGARARQPILEQGGPAARRVRAPLARVLAALRAQGLACVLSNDAGDYLCNQTLHASLLGPAPAVAFLHLPRPRPPGRPRARGSRAARSADKRPDLKGLTRSAVITAMILARYICASTTVKTR